MQSFHNTIKKPDQLLEQIFKRTAENEFKLKSSCCTDAIFLNKPHSSGPLIESLSEHDCLQFEKLESPLLNVSTDIKNSTILLKDSRVCVVRNILKISEQVWFIVQHFSNVTDLYLFPLKSSEVDVYLCSNLSEELNIINFEEVSGKCFKMPYWLSHTTAQSQNPVEGTFVVSLLLL